MDRMQVPFPCCIFDTKQVNKILEQNPWNIAKHINTKRPFDWFIFLMAYNNVTCFTYYQSLHQLRCHLFPSSYKLIILFLQMKHKSSKLLWHVCILQQDELSLIISKDAFRMLPLPNLYFSFPILSLALVSVLIASSCVSTLKKERISLINLNS